MQDAIDMTTRFRTGLPSGMPLSETFDVETITGLLSVQGCKYLRIYYGMKENREVHAILVAADENNADILPAADLETNDNNPIIVDEGIRCPPVCPPPSSLNT